MGCGIPRSRGSRTFVLQATGTGWDFAGKSCPMMIKSFRPALAVQLFEGMRYHHGIFDLPTAHSTYTSTPVNHKAILTLAACFLFCLSAFAAAEPASQGRPGVMPLNPPQLPLGDAGPIADRSQTVADHFAEVTAPPKHLDTATVHPARRTLSACRPSKVLRQADEAPRTRGWVGWLALGTGFATLGLQLAVILISLYLSMFMGGLLLAALGTGILAIVFGSLSISDRRSKAFGPGLAGFIMGVVAFTWPFVALAVILLLV
jgi:hypothetical protein